MSQPNSPTLPVGPPPARAGRECGARARWQQTAWAFLALGIFAAIICAPLSTHWRSNPQYSFGALVFPLALVLLHRRWMARPATECAAPWGKGVMLLAAFVFLPTWLLAQPNPDWRVVSWLLGGEFVALAVGTFAVMGGARWALFFAFPAAFICSAIPWPSAVEEKVIGGLMRVVSAVSVFALNLFGTLAVQQGNLIEVSTGVLGVDEACSGVRSLQATLMAALFLGEFFCFRWQQRAGLVALGIAVSFATNVGRAFFLAQRAAVSGLGAVERWHDPAGFTVVTICFALVTLAAVMMARRLAALPARASNFAPNPIPFAWSGALLGWIVLVVAGTELWFRSGPRAQSGGQQWSFAWPQSAPGFQEVPIAPRAAEMLRYDMGRAGLWSDAIGERWLAFHFRWSAGAGRSRILAAMHRPENCLPSVGWALAEDRGVLTVRAGQLSLPFRALHFVKDGTSAHIWFCLWQDHASGAPPVVEEWAQSAQRASVQAVLRRERGLSQQVLEVALLSAMSGTEADAAFQREIDARIR